MKDSGPQKQRQSTRKKIKKSLGPDFLDPSSIGPHTVVKQSEERCKDKCKGKCSMCLDTSVGAKKDFKACKGCGVSLAHIACIRRRDMIRHTIFEWKCTNCKPCYRCDVLERNAAEYQLVFCMHCKAPYHFQCALDNYQNGVCVLCSEYHPKKREEEDEGNEETRYGSRKTAAASAAQGKRSENNSINTSTASTSAANTTTSRSNISPKSNETSAKRETRRSAERHTTKIIEVPEEPRKSSRRLGSQSVVLEKPIRITISTIDTEQSSLEVRRSELQREKDIESNRVKNYENDREDKSMQMDTYQEDWEAHSSLGKSEASSSDQIQATLPESIVSNEVSRELTPDGAEQKIIPTKTSHTTVKSPSEKESVQINKGETPDKEKATNGISSKIMKDVKGSKNLKSVLFERVCKVGGLLPAQTSDWTVEDVHDFIKFIGFPDAAPSFSKHQIDGKSLLLLTRMDILTGFGFKLGHAIKIYAHIFCLQERRVPLVLDD